MSDPAAGNLLKQFFGIPLNGRWGVLGALGDTIRVISARPVTAVAMGLLFGVIPHVMTGFGQHWYIESGHSFKQPIQRAALTAYYAFVQAPFSAWAVMAGIVIATPILEPSAERLSLGEALRRYTRPAMLQQFLFAFSATALSVLLMSTPIALNFAVGVAFAALFWVIVPALVFEGSGVLLSFVRSARLTSTLILKVMAIVAIVFTPNWILNYGLMRHYPHWATTAFLQYVFIVERSVALGLVQTLSWFSIPAVYFRLRRAREAAAIAAKVFD